MTQQPPQSQPPWGERPVGPPPASQPLPQHQAPARYQAPRQAGQEQPHYLPPQLPPPAQPPQWGPPPWQQGYDPPQAPPPKPRRTAPGVIVALVITGLFLLGAGTVGVSALTRSGTDASDYETPVHETGDGSANDSRTSAAPTTSSEPSSTPSSSAAPTTAPSSGYAPAARPVAALGDNPINIPGNGAVNTPCPLPRFATDTAAQAAFYEAALPCLMAMWAPALREANLPVRMPSVLTIDGTVESPCGTRTWDQTAMFCPGNNTIYMTARYYADKEGRTDAGVFLGQFAHEFGHAVQSMSGINQAYTAASYDANGTSPVGLELTRRSELQATCYEGMALASLQNGGVHNDIIFAALTDSRGRGDEYNAQPDHGSIATNTAWIDQGFYKNRVTECNTWIATPDQVD
ncbi:neutral zinc metallopeptidase [Saccharopolyspora sp. NFXS83]|uniref:neutral zinc metallopeptidase n=1 Tax=Saccharopolyspora sp. NFXS83 TaxID=2993560 RepID=UPI00224AD88C|nr:neutral zinc metallopeptidase [Saccharopolyspora sp. NFXS83]MCX2733431.1 neutral zinc metallopeptidase [Saccharopolyspora sp. NFXS83]